MNLPFAADIDGWNAGRIDDDALAHIESFFADMLSGMVLLGPRYSLAAMALRAEHDAAKAMLDRRREPREVFAASITALGRGGHFQN